MKPGYMAQAAPLDVSVECSVTMD